MAGDLPTLTTGGDISGSIGSVTVNKIKNTSITLTSPAPVDVLLYSGSAWVNYPFSSLAGSSIQSIGTSNSAGSSGDFAQANHVHRLGAGGGVGCNVAVQRARGLHAPGAGQAVEVLQV